jgi:hypothetical protein
MPLTKHVTGQKKRQKNKGSLEITDASTQNVAYEMEERVRLWPTRRKSIRLVSGAGAR